MADNSLLEKVLGLQEKYEALQAQLSDPEVISDMKKFVQLNKEYKELTPIIEAGNEFKKILENYEMAKEILATEKDEDLREMAKEEIAEIEPTLPEWEEKIKLLLIPADPQDSKNAILEIMQFKFLPHIGHFYTFPFVVGVHHHFGGNGSCHFSLYSAKSAGEVKISMSSSENSGL